MMSDERMNPMFDRIRENYNVPPETPREEMWASISARLAANEEGPAAESADVLDLATARRRRIGPTHQAMGWAVAAAAVLVLGIGIGRMTAPPVPGADVAATTDAQPGALALAARDHLGRTESLLTMVRTDARAGRIDPATARWADGLLAQTRLLIDADGTADPVVGALLLDLELLLIQIVGVAETGSVDDARARTELELTLRSLEDGEVISRIQAVLPADMAGA